MKNEIPKMPIAPTEADPNREEIKPEDPKETKTPRRLMFALKTLTEAQVGKIEIRGRENINKIPKGKKVIIATTHITDVDLTLAAYVLGNDFDIAITDQSVHHSFKEEASTNIGIRLAGKDNFLPFDYKKEEDGKKNPRFNPDNFLPMKEALERGKSMMVAAHKPSYQGTLEKGGYGAVYLAGLDPDTVILPVAVNLKSKKNISAKNPLQALVERPDAEITIGSPIVAGTIPNLQIIKTVMSKRKNNESVTTAERLEFQKVSDLLARQSARLMSSLAEMTPEEKRGIYKK